MRRLLLALVGAGATACGTVDLGAYQGVRDLKLDEDVYYCIVQPQVITAKRCAEGDTGDGSGACHSSKSSMILAPIPKSVPCTTANKPIGTPSPEERANYQATQLRVTRDPEAAPLLARPTGKAPHPRVIMDTNSNEANVLRKWIGNAR